ncbi:MAG: sodium:proton antiporter [Salinibacterium sp.]|nr:sodium:proton antiporter [Salinibacterium sp.]
MRISLLGVLGLITIVAAGAFSKKLGVAAPLILIVIGVGFSFIPGAPVIVPAEVILLGLLPPILYSAALNVPVVDFRRNLTSISLLSVALVLVTAAISGLILYLLFPQLSLPAAIAIGAVISPTDAVAATALGRRLGLPPRLVTILEGESLVNDATALVLLRSAIAATAASVAFWDLVGDFVFAVTVALAIGLVVGWATVWVRSKLRDSMLDTAVSFAVPFIAFIPAEYLNASGVLAAVAAGLYSGHYGAKRFSAQARISERLNWRTLQFVLENGVFLLMGIQVSSLIAGVQEEDLSATTAIIVGLVMVLVVLGVRFLFMGPLVLVLRRRDAANERINRRWGSVLEGARRRNDIAINGAETPNPSERLQRRLSRAEKAHKRRAADVVQLRAEGLGWRGGVILGWSGMRGVVTLAAAQSLPDGTPYRAQLVLIAFTVAVVTLLVQGGTLPWIIALTGIRATDDAADRRELAGLLDDIAAAGITVLDNPDFQLPDDQSIDQAIIDRVRHDTLANAESAWEGAEHGAGDDGLVFSPQRQYRELRREVLRAERAALLEARSEGTYPSRILGRVQAMIDLEETRLEQMDTPG